MERFAMDDDFEDVQLIDGEYYYRNRKEKRRQTKDIKQEMTGSITEYISEIRGRGGTDSTQYHAE
ncbi:hypothetical protein QJS10_CPA03g00521 [Acorus calamus]|uniref:Uncharacterized protein n=1 Tax=Acorus calamus TaxID=4465 RepID=A0AAV9F4Q9_ACOCL|nr:hypothetical protein QJS10_CPA03g00521 [Acorus calamus]